MTGVQTCALPILLGLSMAAIAGMVGTGGLGGDVNEAIGQLNVGLGSEAGVAIVILAIYLDRMTSSLGSQVSPLGRRAAAGPPRWQLRSSRGRSSGREPRPGPGSRPSPARARQSRPVRHPEDARCPGVDDRTYRDARTFAEAPHHRKSKNRTPPPPPS